MLGSLLVLFLASPAPAELLVPAGAPIRLDAKVEEAEWKDAFAVTRDRPGGGQLRLRMKRTGPWLALALDAEKRYAGEILRLYTSDAHGAWITNVILGLGQPALPPALWRRTEPAGLGDPERGPGECPRACLLRLDVTGDDRWSAEVLLRLGALGIGRADPRDLRGAIALHAYDPEQVEILALPGTLSNPADPSGYARLVSPDGWGAGEDWPPVTPEQSRAFDDAELLYRLCLEHDGATMRDQPERIVIASAVRPRSAARVAALRRELEAGRERNPTLPAWHYFLARLLNEANLHDEARQLIETIPNSLRRFDAFANLAAEHFIDTERFEIAEEICNAYPYVHNRRDLLTLAGKGKKALEEERVLAEKTAKIREPNPRALLKTAKGDITLELFEDDAPNAVRNFVDLVARKRYYDGLRFHRVEGGRCLRVGDPRTRAGATIDDDGPAWRLRPDASPRPMLRGYVTALPVEGGFHGSQLLISFVPMTELDRALVFARVVEGMDVLLSLEQDDLLEQVEIVSRRNHAYDPMAARLDR